MSDPYAIIADLQSQVRLHRHQRNEARTERDLAEAQLEELLMETSYQLTDKGWAVTDGGEQLWP